MTLDPDDIELVIRARHERQPFSGVIQVREHGQVVVATALGDADRRVGVTNHVSTRFGTASGTKTFTAIAVCQLVEQGRLSLDTRLSEAVDVSLPRYDPAITIHQLLTHTSGAPDYFDEDELDAQADFAAAFGDVQLDHVRSPADIVPLFADKPMRSQPGQRFHYNNGGFVLLGLVIERASGVAYADYVERHVFGRAGMHDAGFFELDALPPRTALGYLPDGRPNSTELTIKGMPDGGAYVTAADMGAFWDTLLAGRLLGRAMRERLLHPHVAVGPTEDDGSHYGYGVWLTVVGDSVTRATVTGADPGVAFVSTRFPARHIDLSVLCNTEADAWPMFAELARLVESDGGPDAPDLTV